MALGDPGTWFEKRSSKPTSYGELNTGTFTRVIYVYGRTPEQIYMSARPASPGAAPTVEAADSATSLPKIGDGMEGIPHVGDWGVEKGMKLRNVTAIPVPKRESDCLMICHYESGLDISPISTTGRHSISGGGGVPNVIWEYDIGVKEVTRYFTVPDADIQYFRTPKDGLPCPYSVQTIIARLPGGRLTWRMKLWGGSVNADEFQGWQRRRVWYIGATARPRQGKDPIFDPSDVVLTFQASDAGWDPRVYDRDPETDEAIGPNHYTEYRMAPAYPFRELFQGWDPGPNVGQPVYSLTAPRAEGHDTSGYSISRSGTNGTRGDRRA